MSTGAGGRCGAKARADTAGRQASALSPALCDIYALCDARDLRHWIPSRGALSACLGCCMLRTVGTLQWSDRVPLAAGGWYGRSGPAHMGNLCALGWCVHTLQPLYAVCARASLHCTVLCYICPVCLQTEGAARRQISSTHPLPSLR